MRRIAAGGECFKGEEGVDDGVDDGAIWTSVNGGGEGRRGEMEEAMMCGVSLVARYCAAVDR
jgi:hypothetical protein